MKKILLQMAAGVLTAWPLSAAVPSPAEIEASLRATQCCVANVKFEVSLPQSADDVVYEIALEAKATPADTLAPASYLIDWTYTNAPNGPVKGFSAYFDGHHYRYSPGRLQEYHFEWDSVPFTAGALSVQKSAQFAWLLPWAVADNIAAAATDPRCSLDVAAKNGGDVELTILQVVAGVECAKTVYRFDGETLRLLRSDSENNLGSIAEQTVKAVYTYPAMAPDCRELTEDMLAAAYGDAFGRYRESNFRIENLRGEPLPEIALPTSTRERYVHHRGDPFRAPTVVVLLDPAAGFAGSTVAKVRDGVAGLPFAADVIWACSGTDVDAAEEAVGRLLPGEHLLVNAASLIRSCGAASLPAVIMARADGTVGDIVLGHNNDLDKLVIQKMTLINQ